ncbi:hypothetical protein GMMP15_90026 [Candidatus Magnetomoraceae bacterium gMMP-15]
MKHIKIALLITLLIISMMIILFHPVFKTNSDTTLSSLLSQKPLEMKNVPVEFKGLLEDSYSMKKNIYDNWGFIYPPSKPVTADYSDYSDQIKMLNQAIDYLKKDKIMIALKSLKSYYSAYSFHSKNTNNEIDSWPNNSTELMIYALTRYTRGIILLKLSDIYCENKKERKKFLMDAVYDLRRSVGVFERLGVLDSNNSTFFKYWGLELHAWDGVSLKREDGDFPVHWAYATLADAYLRIKNLRGYPPVNLNYLRKQRKKYSLGDTGISPLVEDFIDICLKKGKKTSISRYKLTHALHNLEAASRGLSDENTSQFNYLIGIILRNLGSITKEADRSKIYQHARIYLQKAIDSNNDEIKNASSKELILTYIEMKNFREALRELKALDDPLKIRASIIGPYKNYGLLFTDLAQYGNFSKGDLEKVIDYNYLREKEINGNEIKEFHKKIISLLAENFFSDLFARFKEMEKLGRLSEIGSVLKDLYENPNIDKISCMFKEFNKFNLKLPFLMKLNTFLYQNNFISILIIILHCLLLPVLVAYLIWLYQCHKQEAKKILESSYK